MRVKCGKERDFYVLKDRVWGPQTGEEAPDSLAYRPQPEPASSPGCRLSREPTNRRLDGGRSGLPVFSHRNRPAPGAASHGLSAGYDSPKASWGREPAERACGDSPGTRRRARRCDRQSRCCRPRNQNSRDRRDWASRKWLSGSSMAAPLELTRLYLVNCWRDAVGRCGPDALQIFCTGCPACFRSLKSHPLASWGSGSGASRALISERGALTCLPGPSGFREPHTAPQPPGSVYTALGASQGRLYM